MSGGSVNNAQETGSAEATGHESVSTVTIYTNRIPEYTTSDSASQPTQSSEPPLLTSVASPSASAVTEYRGEDNQGNLLNLANPGSTNSGATARSQSDWPASLLPSASTTSDPSASDQLASPTSSPSASDELFSELLPNQSGPSGPSASASVASFLAELLPKPSDTPTDDKSDDSDAIKKARAFFESLKP